MLVWLVHLMKVQLCLQTHTHKQITILWIHITMIPVHTATSFCAQKKKKKKNSETLFYAKLCMNRELLIIMKATDNIHSTDFLLFTVRCTSTSIQNTVDAESCLNVLYFNPFRQNKQIYVI